MKQAAIQATAGATSDEEKVAALIRHLRQNLRELFDPRVTEAERAKILKELSRPRLRTSVEVFKSGIGTADELNTLFAAMASQVGLEARPALVTDRDEIYFDPRIAEVFFLRNIDMAVKIGETWKLYDVSARLLPPTMISWKEEGMAALLSDSKKPIFFQAPISPPDVSQSVRTARMVLSEDGALSGEVEAHHYGHAASEFRIDLDGESEAQQQEYVKEEVRKTYPHAEVTGIRVEGVEDTEKPVVIRYRVKFPEYAQRTGKRLFFQPLFLQRGTQPLFSSTERKYDVHFRYGWQEIDELTIRLPEGFDLDHAENPGNLEFGKPGSYGLAMGINAEGELVCKRKVVFGIDGTLLFPVDVYSKIKKVFDEIHRRDTHVLSLKEAGTK